MFEQYQWYTLFFRIHKGDKNQVIQVHVKLLMFPGWAFWQIPA